MIKLKDLLKEGITENKLSFSQLKKGDVLIGKFPPYKEMEVVSTDNKSAKVKTLKQKNEFDIFSLNNYKLKESVNEAKFKSPDYIISTTPASKLPPTRLAHADVSLGLKMAEKLKNYTLDVRHYNLIHANGKVALKLTPQGKTAVRVRTEDDPKYLQLIQKTVNDIVADYVSEIKESVNEGAGTLTIEKRKDGKYYWQYKFKSGKKEDWPEGFDTKSAAQKDFMYRSKYIKEAKSNYDVYHNSYTSAIQSAREYAEKQGYEINDDDAFRQIGMGPKKPSEGKTNRFSIELSKDGKVQRKRLQIQVYGMKNKYELNTYIN
jgi:hypothetical protein